MLAGIAYLCRAYGIAATPPDTPGYQSVLSMLTAAVFGRGVFYYVTIAAILAVLALSANTSFAGFPRLCRLLAEHGYLPGRFVNRGRRLVFTAGIIVLAVSSGALLVAFGGITDRLIPLFAIGALLRGRRATRSIRISCGYREETMAIQQRWSIHPTPPQFVTLSRDGEHTLTIVDGVARIDGRGVIGGVAAAQFAKK